MVTYVLAPILLVARDGVLWWVIRTFVITKKTREVLGQYCIDKAWLDEGHNTPFRVLGSGSNQKFYLDTVHVTPEVFFHQKEHWDKLTEKTTQQGIYLRAVEKRIDRILKYYKQEEENPLRQNRERLYQSHAQSFINSREEDAAGLSR